MNQPWVSMCPLLLKPPSHLPPHPTPLRCHRAPDLSSLHHTAHFHCLTLHMVMCIFQRYCLTLCFHYMNFKSIYMLLSRTFRYALSMKQMHISGRLAREKKGGNSNKWNYNGKQEM